MAMTDVKLNVNVMNRHFFSRQFYVIFSWGDEDDRDDEEGEIIPSFIHIHLTSKISFDYELVFLRDYQAVT